MDKMISRAFRWSMINHEHEEMRQEILSALVSDSVLIIFNTQFPVELHTDASADGYGAILMHKVNSKPRIIEYYNKSTTGAQTRYHSYELDT